MFVCCIPLDNETCIQTTGEAQSANFANLANFIQGI